MANPQKEDGYTSISNELLEALLKINLSMYEYKVLLAIMRKTYGWSKKSDVISHSQLTELTNISQPHINRTLKYLTDRNIIKSSKLSNIKVEYTMQKDYTLWDIILPNEAIPEQAKPVEVLPPQVLPTEAIKPLRVLPEQATGVLPDEAYTKASKNNTTIKTNTTTKENVKIIFYSFKDKVRYNGLDFDNEFEKFCEYWFEGKQKLKRPTLACHNWLDHCLLFQQNRGNGHKQKSKFTTQPVATKEELEKEWGANGKN